ncbi:60S ribosomal protein L18 [Pseudoloma neurophilia]|uniref:60S ribosomal protein L18 n=1 Tax=Pseudoloma neurophilia TaxID=146866 RepID=A0A0R0M2F0_9MICR|nr:60S ribosomal protein L18 [Pseudoloma neurophilia]
MIKTIHKKQFKLFDTTRKPNSRNPQHVQLFNLFKRISENTQNETVHSITKRLTMSRSNRQPVKLSKLVEHAGKTIVIIGKVLDDEKLFEIPKLKVLALNFSREAKKKILKFGGEIFFLDQLFTVSNDLSDVILVSGDRTHRKCYKYFGAPGEKGSTAYPRTTNPRNSGEKRINQPKK